MPVSLTGRKTQTRSGVQLSCSLPHMCSLCVSLVGIRPPSYQTTADTTTLQPPSNPLKTPIYSCFDLFQSGARSHMVSGGGITSLVISSRQIGLALSFFFSSSFLFFFLSFFLTFSSPCLPGTISRLSRVCLNLLVNLISPF